MPDYKHLNKCNPFSGLVRRPTNVYVVIHAQNMFLASLVLGMVTAILPWWDIFCLISLLHLTPP